ncbi:MAG: aldose 1-epimerase family protein [Clostridia bacterium]|nr:aldose 1-epimerase family protein [Clostridia bacterium]
MQYTLSNGILTATFNTRGAELISLKNSDGKEFIFRDPNFWGFSCPTLFPICGGLKDGKFIYEGKEYFLEKHGFCRMAEFEVLSETDSEIAFITRSSEDTLKVYPFEFEFIIRYTLDGNALTIGYETNNLTDGKMYYSVGCHEAYLCRGGIEKYQLVFDETETLDAHGVDGVMATYETRNVITESKILPLRYSDYDIDALIFSKLNSRGVTLRALDGNHEVKVDFPGLPHLLLWTPASKEAPFICIEPWHGLPDMTDSRYDITQRTGIICLEKGESRTLIHKITFIK